MLGYCGVNCAECPAYQGTVGSKMELLEKASQVFGNGAHSAKEWVCLGCTPADQAFLAKPCAACEMRTCAIAKGVQNCAACADYESCQRIQKILEPWGLSERMGWLRERFKAIQSGNG
jgi:hypothetical protein